MPGIVDAFRLMGAFAVLVVSGAFRSQALSRILARSWRASSLAGTLEFAAYGREDDLARDAPLSGFPGAGIPYLPPLACG